MSWISFLKNKFTCHSRTVDIEFESYLGVIVGGLTLSVPLLNQWTKSIFDFIFDISGGARGGPEGAEPHLETFKPPLEKNIKSSRLSEKMKIIIRNHPIVFRLIFVKKQQYFIFILFNVFHWLIFVRLFTEWYS
jgi:hypothetical protein